MRRSNLFLISSKSIGRFFPVVLWLMSFSAFGGGGPLGIDHRLAFDDSGIWKRSNQTGLQNLMIAGVVAPIQRSSYGPEIHLLAQTA